MRIEINDANSNQDNSAMWVNPLLKTKFGKLLLIVGCTPVYIVLFGLLDWKEIYSENKIICLLQIFFLLISIIFVIIKYIISRINVYKIEEKNKTVDYEYYRDLLDETSAGVLSFVYNKKISYKDIVISTILKLEKEENIKIDYENNRIEILLDDSDKLSEYEKYILEVLKKTSKKQNNKIKFSNISKILSNENFKINVKELIKKSSKDKGYYEAKGFGASIMVFLILINFCITMFSFFANAEIGTVCLINTMIMFFLGFVANKKIYIRTEKGKLLADQLNGLKRFLVEYSKIDERKIEEISLWDYYIIYAIIFDLKGNLDDEVEKLYNILTKKI